MLDAIVARHQMRFTLGRLLAMLTRSRPVREDRPLRKKK